MTMKILLRAAVVVALVGCGGSRKGTTDGAVGGNGGGAMGDGAAGAGTAGAAGSGTGTAGAAGSGTDAAVSCTPGTKQCEGSTAAICVATGDAWNRLACPNGCEAGACKPISLERGWMVHQYNLTDDSIQTPASYTFEQNGLIAVQSANPMASVYYDDTALPEGIVVTGR